MIEDNKAMSVKPQFLENELKRIQTKDYSSCAVFTDPLAKDDPIIYATKEFFNATGYDEKDVIGRNCRFLQGHMTDQTELDRLRRCLETNETFKVTLHNYRADGSYFLNELSIRPIFDRHGKLVRRAGYQTVVDVEQPQINSALKNFTDQSFEGQKKHRA